MEHDNYLHATFFSNRFLELILLPTEQCNFRCTYCYENFTGRLMTEEIVSSILNLISQRAPELSQLRLGWFGGEPLLAQSIVRRISAHAMSEAQKHDEILFESGMSTNGYLLDPITAEKLISCGVTEYQISLDGPAVVHDKSRVTRHGKGTFSRIWSNLIALRDSQLEFKVNLRVHMSQVSAPYLEQFIEVVSEAFSGDERFRLFLKTIEQLGGTKDQHIEVIHGDEKKELEARLSDIAIKHDLKLLQTDDSYICYAARPTSFVIRHNGAIVKCTVELDEADNNIGILLPEGKLQIDQAKVRPWLKGAVSLNKDMLACPRHTLIR
ncbi:MAG: radical SAM protein [Candidatus Sedimenticola sp. 6PFRAG7]